MAATSKLGTGQLAVPVPPIGTAENLYGAAFCSRFLLRNWATNGRFVSYYFQQDAARVIENEKAIANKIIALGR